MGNVDSDSRSGFDGQPPGRTQWWWGNQSVPTRITPGAQTRGLRGPHKSIAAVCTVGLRRAREAVGGGPAGWARKVHLTRPHGVGGV